MKKDNWFHYDYKDKMIIVNAFLVDDELQTNLFIANKENFMPDTDASVYDVMQEVQQT
tara:strand:+ start:45 stop:218 length:174 start_codon:yes stop_codon:yes gene_type:complete